MNCPYPLELSYILVNERHLQELIQWGLEDNPMMEKQGVIKPGVTPDLDNKEWAKRAEDEAEAEAMELLTKTAELEKQDPNARLADNVSNS